MLHVEWYHVCWPRLTAERVEPVVSISWASCLRRHKCVESRTSEVLYCGYWVDGHQFTLSRSVTHFQAISNDANFYDYYVQLRIRVLVCYCAFRSCWLNMSNIFLNYRDARDIERGTLPAFVFCYVCKLKDFDFYSMYNNRPMSINLAS